MLETGIDRGRRRALLSAAALAAGPWHIARAAAYPERPLRFVVPGGAGGAPDLLCRVMGAALAKGLGQAVVIENRPGAGGIVGISEVARAAPDGYTIGYANVGTLAINKSLYARLPYDPARQLAPVAMTGFAVFLPRTISSSRITLAGEKKCRPSTCSGRFVTEAISSMSR